MQLYIWRKWEIIAPKRFHDNGDYVIIALAMASSIDEAIRLILAVNSDITEFELINNSPEVLEITKFGTAFYV